MRLIYNIAAVLAVILMVPAFFIRGIREQGFVERIKQQLGFETAVLESRDVAVGFYEKLGYTADRSRVIHGGTFPCIPMEKPL